MQDDEVISAGPDYWMPYNMEPVHMAITADGMPVTPPSSWFNDPQLTRPTALVVEPNGHVYGHIACWETKHIGMPGAIKPPRSKTNYAFFATGAVQTAEGAHVNVGQITLVGGHAPIDVDVPRAVAHYDDTDSAVCDVAIGEDRYGIWVAGALRPDIDDVKIRQLRASAVSGDWRPINGNLELVAVCSVNVPGFPIPRARVASGQTLALVAAGIEPLVEDRLRGYGGYSEVDIDGVLMALAARVERLEAWMLALVDPNETTALGRESYDDWEDEYEHDEGHHEKCACGMCGGYGKKRKKMGMYAGGVSSKDIKQNVTAAGSGTDVESLRRRVHAPMIASLRERVHGTESAAAALRARVHGNEPLTAASRPWNKNLHPRGKDGKFIEKLGFVKFASGIGRKQDKGKVIGVKKGKNKDGMILSIEKNDGTIVEKMPSEVSSTAAPKASINVKESAAKVPDAGKQSGNAPGVWRTNEARRAGKNFSRQNEIDELWTNYEKRVKKDDYGRSMTPKERDKLIELLEAKRDETGFGGASDEVDLKIATASRDNELNANARKGAFGEWDDWTESEGMSDPYRKEFSTSLGNGDFALLVEDTDDGAVWTLVDNEGEELGSGSAKTTTSNAAKALALSQADKIIADRIREEEDTGTDELDTAFDKQSGNTSNIPDVEDLLGDTGLVTKALKDVLDQSLTRVSNENRGKLIDSLFGWSKEVMGDWKEGDPEEDLFDIEALRNAMDRDKNRDKYESQIDEITEFLDDVGYDREREEDTNAGPIGDSSYDELTRMGEDLMELYNEVVQTTGNEDADEILTTIFDRDPEYARKFDGEDLRVIGEAMGPAFAGVVEEKILEQIGYDREREEDENINAGPVGDSSYDYDPVNVSDILDTPGDDLDYDEVSAALALIEQADANDDSDTQQQLLDHLVDYANSLIATGPEDVDADSLESASALRDAMKKFDPEGYRAEITDLTDLIDEAEAVVD
jgi:hypothetical protein